MKKDSTIKTKVKSAQKQIESSLVAELTSVTGKLGKGSKKLIKKIEKGSKKLAKQLTKQLEFAETAVVKEAKPVVKSVMEAPGKKEAEKSVVASAKPAEAKPAVKAPAKPAAKPAVSKTPVKK